MVMPRSFRVVFKQTCRHERRPLFFLRSDFFQLASHSFYSFHSVAFSPSVEVSALLRPSSHRLQSNYSNPCFLPELQYTLLKICTGLLENACVELFMGNSIQNYGASPATRDTDIHGFRLTPKAITLNNLEH